MKCNQEEIFSLRYLAISIKSSEINFKVAWLVVIKKKRCISKVFLMIAETFTRRDCDRNFEA